MMIFRLAITVPDSSFMYGVLVTDRYGTVMHVARQGEQFVVIAGVERCDFQRSLETSRFVRRTNIPKQLKLSQGQCTRSSAIYSVAGSLHSKRNSVLPATKQAQRPLADILS
jgi:hypothetical protein